MVASIQTLAKRLDLGFTPSLVVIDEAHHAVAKTYRQLWDAWDIAHAEHIAEYYREQGVAAYAISSKTPMDVRKHIQKRPLTIDVQTMIINKYGKEVEKKRIKGEEYDD